MEALSYRLCAHIEAITEVVVGNGSEDDVRGVGCVFNEFCCEDKITTGALIALGLFLLRAPNARADDVHIGSALGTEWEVLLFFLQSGEAAIGRRFRGWGGWLGG